MRFVLDEVCAVSGRSAVACVRGSGVDRSGRAAAVYTAHAWQFRDGWLWRSRSFANREDAERAARAAA